MTLWVCEILCVVMFVHLICNSCTLNCSISADIHTFRDEGWYDIGPIYMWVWGRLSGH